MKKSEAVSLVENTLKSLNKDVFIPRRYILSVLNNISRTYIAQRLQERTINNESNLYSEIRCVEFEQIEAVKCPIIEFRRCSILMKSKKPLPEVIYSRLGAGIKEVTSIDGEHEFKIVTEDQYRRSKKRKYSFDETSIYLGTDKHLYIPDEQVMMVDITILTLNTEDIDECSSCSDNKCEDAWDSEFIAPNKLETLIIDKAIQTISLSKQIQPDVNSNGIPQG